MIANPNGVCKPKRSSTCDPAVTESRDYPRFQGLCKCSCHQDVRRAIKPQQKLRIQAAIFKLLTMQIASLVWNLDIQKEIESAQILWGIDSWMSNCISSFDSQQIERWKQLPLSISLHQPVQNQLICYQDDPRIAKHIRNSLELQSNKLEQSQKQSEAFGISPYFSINIYIYNIMIGFILGSCCSRVLQPSPKSWHVVGLPSAGCGDLGTIRDSCSQQDWYMNRNWYRYLNHEHWHICI